MNKWRVVLIVLALIIVVVIVFQVCRPELEDIVSDYGFNYLVPPSTLHAPGTLVYLDDRDPPRLGILCTAKNSLGDEFEVLSSATQSLREELNRQFSISGEFQRLVQVEFPLVQDVHLRLTSPIIYELPTDEIIEHIDRRSPSCSAAVKRYVEEHIPISMITTVLQADVEYIVRLNADPSAEVAEGVLADLASDLGGEYESGAERVIVGRGLYWGTRDQKNLILPADPEAGIGPAKVEIATLPKLIVGPVPSTLDTTDAVRIGDRRIEIRKIEPGIRLLPAGESSIGSFRTQ